ncbi:MAG: glycerol-3-phosphate dehydrogenase, partial [Candidatus Delongbacteria bacterium]|nr:glycerol-3-phosphate dehydrogenase [Candidatus Delongbacteria bacterium]
MKIAVLGAGAWGLAIADVIAKKDFSVSVWEFDKDICNELNNTRKVENKLPGYIIS